MKIVGLIFPETEEQTSAETEEQTSAETEEQTSAETEEQTSAETEEQTFCCSECGKKYKSGTALQKHMKEKHSDESEE